MYQPGGGSKVSRIQETLQKLQRSPEGWQLAQSLLGSKEETVRFFGALTFIVKLNTDPKSLSNDDAQALLQNIIGWLIQSLEKGEGAVVVRKLCSVLAAYFLQFSQSWTRCVKHLLYCLCLGRATTYSDIGDAPDSTVLIQRLSSDKAVIIFWFISTLVEDVGKMDSNSMKQHKFHQQVIPNVEDVVPLIQKYIAGDAVANDVKVRQEAMSCFQAWVSYSHRAFIDDEVVLDPLKTLTKPAIMSLVDNDLYEISVELITDVLSNFSKFLQKEDMDLLFSLFNSQWAQERYQRLIDGDFDFDSVQFGLFMIAFGDANVEDLAQKAGTDPQCGQFLSALGGLLRAEGYAVNEDKIFVPALEFWSTLVESMIDITYSSDSGHPAWFSAVSEHVMQAIQNCWRKIQFPPQEEFDVWDSVDRTGFKDARRDVSDLLGQFFLISDIPILNVFIDLTQRSIASRNWTELEASLYCISRFADCISKHSEEDQYLSRVFEPSLISLLTSQPEIPVRTTHVFLSLLREYSEYFERHSELLPQVLNVVFGSANSPSLAKNASWAIVELCSKCRSILVPELGVFLQQLAGMINTASLESSVKEGIMQGISSIIQAISTEEAKVVPLEQLLYFIEVDVEQCIQLLSNLSSQQGAFTAPLTLDMPTEYNTACEFGLTALRCLEGVAKGLQIPTDAPVDLEKKSRSTFWTTGSGSNFQHRIISIITRLFETLSNRSDIVDAICKVFRCGFRELEPGPFVFPATTVAQLLLKANLQTPRLGAVITSASSLISSHQYDQGIQEVADVLVKWVGQILQTLGDPSNDPEVAQNGIEFLNRLASTYPGTLMSQDTASLWNAFIFTLKALRGSDPLPKHAAADFWTTFIGLQDQGSSLQDSIDSAWQELGPLLTEALVFNISGDAARSDLDKLCDPLKKLVVRQLRSKSWLEAALLAENFPSNKVAAKDKAVFLQKLMSLRGARGTAQVVRDFWLACRGSNFGYAS